MATTKQRLEQIENALLVLAGGTAGFGVGRRGAVGAARAVGRAALVTAPGRAVLTGVAYSELVDELNARDREIARAEGTENVFMEAQRRLPGPIPLLPGFTASQAKKARKKTVSTFNRAVKSGMAAVKRSRFNGKAGSFRNSKTAFATVAKTVSRAKKGAKLSTKGVTGVIKKAISRYTKGWKLTKKGKPQRYTGGQR
jgi:hypothetical protein